MSVHFIVCSAITLLYSLERRRERYLIIYVWKILEGHVPNINCKIISTQHVRFGRKCNIPIVKNGRLQKACNASLTVNGVNLFNTLPKSVCDLSGVKVETFKSVLDTYLKYIPDQPQLAGYMEHGMASSNSIIQMQNCTHKSDARCISHLDMALASVQSSDL